MLQHVVDGTLHAHAAVEQTGDTRGDLIPHLLAQATRRQTIDGAIGAGVARFLLAGLEQVAHAAISALVIYVIMGMAVGDGELDGGTAGFGSRNALPDQGVEGGMVEFQELLVSLLAQVVPPGYNILGVLSSICPIIFKNYQKQQQCSDVSSPAPMRADGSAIFPLHRGCRWGIPSFPFASCWG